MGMEGEGREREKERETERVGALLFYIKGLSFFVMKFYF